jgi:F-type H+-transporting ATPase subunit alpha
MSNFEKYIDQTKEYGVVEQVRHPVVMVSGLPGAKINEIIIFEDDSVGQVASLEVNTVEVITFSQVPAQAGMRVTRTNDKLYISVGDQLLGKVIDPLGNLLFGTLDKVPDAKREIDIAPPRIDKRARITKQLQTGVSVIDSMLPLGKGQRELVVGDRKTGKTSFVFNIARTIAETSPNDIVIYASIGKERSESKRLKETFQKELDQGKIVIVASSSDQSPSLIDLTPYSAMTLAEYFRDAGKDVLVVLDDLSTHAKFYREMALLSKRFPGRDSYPGDIFYKHARLLERAGNFKLADGKEACITCLPIAETQDSTLTDYITSNLIGITDGHILFDIEAFNKGMRPAVDIFLSVTRVGKQTQTKLTREITGNALKLLKVYNDTLAYQHFGAELSTDVKKLIDKGEKIYKFFEQNTDVSVPPQIQALFLTLLIEGNFNKRRTADVVSYRSVLLDNYRKDTAVKSKIDSLFEAKSYKEYLTAINADPNSVYKWLGFLK